MLIPLFFVSLFLAYSLVPIIASDGSGSTKFQIFNSFFDLIGLDILGDIFGRGLVSGGSYFSFQSGVKYAHSAIPLIIGIFGIIGFCVYGSILLYAMYRNRIFISTFAIFFVLGFSYLEVLFEGLFLLLGLSLNKHLVKDINWTAYFGSVWEYFYSKFWVYKKNIVSDLLFSIILFIVSIKFGMKK